MDKQNPQPSGEPLHPSQAHDHSSHQPPNEATSHPHLEMEPTAHPGGVEPVGHDTPHAHHPSVSPTTGQAEMMDHPGHEHALSQPASSAEHKAHTDHTGHERLFRDRFWVCLVLSIPVLLYSPMIQEWLGFSIPSFPLSQWIVPLFSVIVFLYGGPAFLRMGVPALQNRQPGMMTLISLAIGVSFIYSLATTAFNLGESFYWELVTLIDVMLLGHWMEMRSVRQASGALNELAKLMPDTAERIRENGQAEIAPASQLQVGALLLVRPRAGVPADGTVEEGESAVNEAMITGESRPVKKAPDDRVIAGTINGDASLRVRVTATGDQTALAGIMRLVEQAQQSKSSTQLLADRAAGWVVFFSPAVSGP